MSDIKGIKIFFNRAADNNLTMLIMYYLAYPLVILFEKLKFKPNTVTLLSVFFGIISVFSLIKIDSIKYFMLFFFLSQLLDHVDGTLARKTNQINKSKIDIDHVSDLFKVTITLIAFGYFFNLPVIWTLCISSLIFLFLHEYLRTRNEKKSIVKKNYKKKSGKNLIRDSFYIVKFFYGIPFVGDVLKFIYRFCTTLQSQTILTFIIAPLNEYFCIGVLLYLIFVINFTILKFFIFPKIKIYRF